LPLQAIKAAAAVLAAILVVAGRRKLAIACLRAGGRFPAPTTRRQPLCAAERADARKPYIVRHIEATRAAYGLDMRARVVDFAAQKEGRIDFACEPSPARKRTAVGLARLHDTSAKSALRPYTYADTDVDRYQIDGRLRQTLLAPRELDLNQLGDARNRWINRALTFTHGYGFVLAEPTRSVTRIASLLVLNAPLEVKTKSLKPSGQKFTTARPWTRGVRRTSQPDSTTLGSSEVTTRYEGKGGFPMSSLGMRTLATVATATGNFY